MRWCSIGVEQAIALDDDGRSLSIQRDERMESPCMHDMKFSYFENQDTLSRSSLFSDFTAFFICFVPISNYLVSKKVFPHQKLFNKHVYVATVMAAAEARAAWQRTANRCFVQEDAKRAPKLACCPSSSSSKPPVDTSNGDEASGPDHPASGFTPLNWNPTSSTLPPDTKWWLQLQPNFTSQKEYMYEHVSALEAELEGAENKDATPTSEITEKPTPIEDSGVDHDNNACPSVESHWRVSTACMKHESEGRVQELKALNLNKQQPLKPKSGMDENWYQHEDLMDWEPVDKLISNQSVKSCLDLDAPWIGGGKTEPWWRTADQDELASLVAQKSHEQIENCDLPRPQPMHIRRGPFACLETFGYDAMISSSLDLKMHSDLCNQTDYAQHSLTSGKIDGKYWLASEVRYRLSDSEKLGRYVGCKLLLVLLYVSPEK
ncbi:hypothetical protein ACLOJK_010315 [Asimina triloba]